MLYKKNTFESLNEKSPIESLTKLFASGFIIFYCRSLHHMKLKLFSFS